MVLKRVFLFQNLRCFNQKCTCIQKQKKVAEAIEGDNSRNTENDKQKEKALEAAKAATNKTLPNEATPGMVAGAKVGGETAVVKQGISEEEDLVEAKTFETESGTAKVTDTHVHFDNSGYEQKFAHHEIHKMIAGKTVRGFKKDNEYSTGDTHVFTNNEEDHYLPTKAMKHVKESVDLTDKAEEVNELSKAYLQMKKYQKKKWLKKKWKKC